MGKKKVLLVVGIIAVLIGIFYAFTYSEIRGSKQDLPVFGNPGHKVGPFAFVDQEGDTVTENALNGKVSVVEYFFTRCTAICPKMNKNMDRIYEQFKGEPGFQILSNTVDPENDRVSVLAKYAEQWGADAATWKFLTGNRKELFDVAVHQYLLNVADSLGVNDQFVHTQFFALVDQDRQIRGFYDGLQQKDLKKLETDISGLLKERD